MASASSADSNARGQTQQGPQHRSDNTQGAATRNPRLLNTLFPLSYKEGFSQWWAAITPAAAEASVLAFLPFNHPSPAVSTSDPHTVATSSPPEKDPYGPRQCTSNLVELSGKNRALNEFSITRTAEPEAENHLVMLHGYGAGLAFFYRNYDALSRVPNWKLWSLDLLGYGRSTRPPFLIHSKDAEGKITEAEDWFIDALEEWRKKRGIERITLLGHSFGGYLSIRYSIKYPERVNKLILASPVGVPEDPHAIQEALPDNKIEAEQTALQNELLESQEFASRSSPNLPESLKSHDMNGSASGLTSSSSPSIQTINNHGNAPSSSEKPRRVIPKWFAYLWDANISPFSLVRWSGPFGPRLVSGWTSRRFNHLPEEESQALHNYSYSLFRQSGSGEYALAYILAPGAYARRPLIWRVQDLVNKVPGGIPSVWMYGELDWMDVAGGFAAEEKIRSTKLPNKNDSSTGKERENGFVGGGEWRGNHPGRGGEAKVLIVQKSGHHLYLEGADEFNDMIVIEMKDVEKREKARTSNTQRNST